MYRQHEFLKKTNDDLLIEGCSSQQLVKKYGSPLYVYSKQQIIKNYQKLDQAFKKNYSNFQICYAVKANSNINIIKILKEEGCGADCSSAIEIAYAEAAGLDSSKCLFTSVNPNADDLASALKHGYSINLDDVELLDSLLKVGSPEFISFRVNPGIGAGKFTQIIVGGEGTKFGIHEDRAIEAYKKAKAAGIKRFGIHMMTGSCILEGDYFSRICEKLLGIAGRIKKELAIEFDYIDIGGGFGIPYEEDESELDIEKVAKDLCDNYQQYCAQFDLGSPKLLVEPGRYLVGNAGVLLSTINHIKKNNKGSPYLGLDAGMGTLMRPALYGAYHDIVPVKQDMSEAKTKYNIVGPICESTDSFAKDRSLATVQSGELLAILDAGAYGYAMGSCFNGRLLPAEVLADQGSDKLIRRAQETKDVLAQQL